MKKIILLAIAIALIASFAHAGSAERVAYVDATENGFQGRCKYFFQKAAIAVMSEDPGTANHDDRVRFAAKVITGGISQTELAIAVATNSTIAATIDSAGTPSDNDLEFTVNSMFDAFAISSRYTR